MLRLLKPLLIAREVFRCDALPTAAAGYVRDTITLGWEERLKARTRRRTAAGFEFATALPRGAMLRGGDCFVLDEARTIVEVIEREEPVFLIEPASPREWGLFAYQIGNSHQPMMISEAGIVCPDVPGMQQLLELHGIGFSRAMQPFTPVGVVPDHRHG